MGFVHGYILFGLVAMGLPIVFHLIMRQKPKIVKFPAIRFLIQKRQTNQRRMNLQHLLLLLLRMLAIAFLCLALARPKISMGDFSFGREQRVAAVFIFDNSPSMDYKVGEKNRLDEARQQALKFLDEMSPESKVAIVDLADQRESGKAGIQDWLPGRRQIDQKLQSIKISSKASSITSQVNYALKLLESLGDSDDVPPRFLFVFSDRTQRSWEGMANSGIQVPKNVSVVYIDVGEDKPAEVAIDRVLVEPTPVEPGGKMQVRLNLRSVGMEHKSLVECQLEDQPADKKIADKKSLVVPKDQSTELVFELPVPKPQVPGVEFIQIVSKINSSDAWAGNDIRYATVSMREKPKILILASDAKKPRIFKAALDAVGAFQTEIKPWDFILGAKITDLVNFRVIVMFQVDRPEAGAWGNLEAFVKNGGGLAIIPSGTLVSTTYESSEAQRLLAGSYQSLEKVGEGKQGYYLDVFDYSHPMLAPFKEWIASADPDFKRPELMPFVNGRWKVQPLADAMVLGNYLEEGGVKSPAFMEKSVGEGKVIQFTTPLDGTEMEKNRSWNNYWKDSSFGLILADRTCKYLAGESRVPDLQFSSGQPAVLDISPSDWRPPFKVVGPGISNSEGLVLAGDARAPLIIRQAIEPGNYKLLDARDKVVGSFSMNIPIEETLLDKISEETVEKILGKGCVVPLGRNADLTERIRQTYQPPLELMPWFLVLLPVLLAFESLVANKFYKKEAQPA